MLDVGLSEATGVRDIAGYLLLFFLGLRIGHCAVSPPSQARGSEDREPRRVARNFKPSAIAFLPRQGK